MPVHQLTLSKDKRLSIEEIRALLAGVRASVRTLGTEIDELSLRLGGLAPHPGTPDAVEEAETRTETEECRG